MSNPLLGPGATFDSATNHDFLIALRAEAIRTRAAADGALQAWKKEIDKFASCAASRLGYVRDEVYDLKLSAECIESLGVANSIFIFSHAEGTEFGLPGLYFYPRKKDGSRHRGKGPWRLLDLSGDSL